jgi:two-component system, chemotaxis family, CheB/CheR fusion protein
LSPREELGYVVGIGASAGGLRALQSFFKELPVESGMSFVVVVHLDPKAKSALTELLQPKTSMPVTQVVRAVKVEPNHVYIIPPDKDLSMADSTLRLSPRTELRRNQAPIDFFLRSLAETHERSAIGILLSGSGSDGVQGLKWIKEHGGMTLVQSPEDAEFDSMPRNAIQRGVVDRVLPAAELGAEVVRLRIAADEIQLNSTTAAPDDQHATLGKLFALLRARTGHDFSNYKKATVLRRIERRMQFARQESLGDYLGFVRQRPDEVKGLFNDLLITVTSFFRDPEAFDALEAQVIPKLITEFSGEKEMRGWVAGCSTGEEAYSVSILLCEQAARVDDPPKFQIFASDLADTVFPFAREGLYPDSIAADVKPERLARFFTREPTGYRVKKSVRERVLFAPHDLLKDPPFARLDLIVCRNVLIYLEANLQRQVLEVFHYALKPGGFLFLGSSESGEAASDLFSPVDKKHRLFVRQSSSPKTPPRMPHRKSPPRIRVDPDEVAIAPPARAPSVAELHRELLEAYAPPSLVVDNERRLVHLSDRVGRYLRLAGGGPSQDVLDLVPGELKHQLRILLDRALRKGEPGEALDIPVAYEGETRRIDVFVRPAGDENRFALVVFQENPVTETAPTESPKATSRSQVQRLEDDLNRARQELQSNLEEHENTVEEFRAANEELQSINEEQRATSEELETSKEELQSINEELHTTNQEFRIKNEELSQVNSDLLNLMNSTEIGTVFLDQDLRIRRYTPPMTRLFSFSETDRGRHLSDLTNRLSYKDLIPDARRVLETLEKTEREVTTDDGSWFVVRISPYRSMDDRIDGVVLTFFDTTARKEAELERETLLTEARAANEAKSAFISVMSHEFRTPLNAIIGYTDLLLGYPEVELTHNQVERLQRVRTSAWHLVSMVEEILTFSRIEAGQETLRRESVDLVNLASEAVAVIGPAADFAGLELRVELPNAPITMTTDAGKIRQILVNLLSNAVKFTPKGHVSLRLTNERASVIFEIDDTGIGIAPENLERIFDRFWQAEQGRTRRFSGTGLGLTVTRGLVYLFGGNVEVSSQLDKGSTFRVVLPVKYGTAIPVI